MTPESLDQMTDPYKKPLVGVSLADALAQAYMDYASAPQEAAMVFAWFAANRDTLVQIPDVQSAGWMSAEQFDALLATARQIGERTMSHPDDDGWKDFADAEEGAVTRMNPERIAEIRHSATLGDTFRSHEVMALCDALEAAQAENATACRKHAEEHDTFEAAQPEAAATESEDQQ